MRPCGIANALCLPVCAVYSKSAFDCEIGGMDHDAQTVMSSQPYSLIGYHDLSEICARKFASSFPDGLHSCHSSFCVRSHTQCTFTCRWYMYAGNQDPWQYSLGICRQWTPVSRPASDFHRSAPTALAFVWDHVDTKEEQTSSTGD